MKHSHVRLATIFGALLAAGAVGGYAAYPESPALDRMMASTVMLTDGTGHGSGVAIAADLILTAAHVTEGSAEFTVTTSGGEQHKAEVLWESPSRDVALLRVTDGARLAHSEMACRPTVLDEAVTLIGNPVVARFRVAHGTVASRMPIENSGLNRTDVALDMSIAGGDSGGPVFDADGRVIGLARATLVQPLGPFAATFIGVGVMTPSANICQLLGRS